MGNCTSKPSPGSSTSAVLDSSIPVVRIRYLSCDECAVPYSARIAAMREDRSKLRTDAEIKKFQIESSEVHWSELAPASDSDCSAETNREYFESLKKDPQWCRFFRDFDGLVVGEKIGEGAQADLYKACKASDPHELNSTEISLDDDRYDYVLKVLKGSDAGHIQSFQAQWPLGMLCARSKFKQLFASPLISIRGATLLKEERSGGRLKGRFAFLMYRRWGDLRKLIDERMIECKPFTIMEATQAMLGIAQDMHTLHTKHDILHRDLKSSNVLVWGTDTGGLVPVGNAASRYPSKGIETLVTDFECSVGVIGTGFWRAPEILQQLKDGVPGSEVTFTRESDVYSYGMTCYEIVTGCIPFEGIVCSTNTYEIVLSGKRPENLPHDLPQFIRDIIVSCWHSDPMLRPSFSEICLLLEAGIKNEIWM